MNVLMLLGGRAIIDQNKFMSETGVIKVLWNRRLKSVLG